MKFQVKRVSGAQAESAQRLGLVKITASSAEHLFDLGIPFYIVGNNVNGYHFFGGWHLAMPVNSEEYVSEGRSFRGMVGNWSQYNENSETGKAAFFVKRKYVASPEDVAAEAKKRSHKSKTGAKGKRRKSKPSYETTKIRRLQRRAAKHGLALSRSAASKVAFGPGTTKWDDMLEERARELKYRRDVGISKHANVSEDFDPRNRDRDVSQASMHERFMRLPRPALPNPPRRSKKARRR